MRPEALWASIAATLSREITADVYPPGAKLPTEAALAMRFGVNRHTVRRALSALRDQGSLHSRRGSGVFVTARPTEYKLGRRVRFRQNVADSGRAPSRRITRRETRPASADEREALRIDEGAEVQVIEGISFVDGQPLAAFRSVFPASRFPGLIMAMTGQDSVTAALAACGLPDYTRAGTRLTAEAASPVLAAALQMRAGAPILRSVSLNVDAKGVPVEFGTTWFAGERVTLTVTPDQP